MKKILVISHERSGTHFLINSIVSNFPGFERSGNVINVPTEKMTPIYLQNWFRINSTKCSNILYKSHHQFYWFQKFFYKLLIENFHIFYVIRDGRDVMTSCFHYYNKCSSYSRHFQLICADTMSGFLRMNPRANGLTVDDYSFRNTSNPVERWVAHIRSWLQVRYDINIISYEELNNNFEDTIRRIGLILDLDIPQNPERPDLSAPSICPRKGIVGDWKNIFEEEDLAFFNSIAFDCMKDLEYYKNGK